MGSPLQIKPDRNFAPLLATFCVLVGGAAGCIGIMFAAGEVKTTPILMVVGVGLGMGFLLWLLRDKPVAQQRHWFAWVMHGRGRKQRTSYEFRKVTPRGPMTPKAPPTLEDLRAQKDATRTWTPSAGRRSPRGSTGAET